MKLSLSALCCVCALSMPVLAGGQGLEDMVRNLEPGQSMSITLDPMHPSLDVPTELKAADLVVEGAILKHLSSVIPAPYYVSTTYSVGVDRVLFNRAMLPIMPAQDITSVSVRRHGGQVVVDGHQVSVVDSTLPAFEAGTYLVLFLKRAAQDYEIVGGPYGVFREEDGHVRSLLTVDTRMKEKYDGLDVTAFRNAVSGALRK